MHQVLLFIGACTCSVNVMVMVLPVVAENVSSPVIADS